MVATSRIAMSDISRQKRFETTLDGQLTPRHTVAQLIDFYLAQVGIPQGNVRWSAFAKGLKLDNKTELGNLAVENQVDLTIMPEVSAGR